MNEAEYGFEIGSHPLSGDPFIQYLRSISGRHVHFFPKSGNAGDGFIAFATYTLFDKFGITFTTHAQSETVEGKLILIGGGGNLIQGRYDDVAELIRRHRDNNEIVLLPHTIVGYTDILAETHRNLTVFCRDPVSYQLAMSNGADEKRTHLSHDVVFFLEDDHFRSLLKDGHGMLQALRQDGETAGTLPISPSNIDISLSWNGDLWTSPQFADFSTKSMAAFIAPYAIVVSDRLHVAILSCFLQKKVYMLPNAYFKNRAIFEHSIVGRFQNVEFVNTLPWREVQDFQVGTAGATDWRAECEQRIRAEFEAFRELQLREAISAEFASERLDKEKEIFDLKLSLDREHSKRLLLASELDSERQIWAERSNASPVKNDSSRLPLLSLGKGVEENGGGWHIPSPLRRSVHFLRRIRIKISHKK